MRDAILRSGQIPLSRVIIARRERVVAIMPMGRGLVVHTTHEERNLNKCRRGVRPPAGGQDGPRDGRAGHTQLIQRQTSPFDWADLEDGDETRLQAVIQAKPEGEGLQPEDGEPADRSNVIDLIAALKKSLASDERATTAKRPGKAAAPSETKSTQRRAPGGEEVGSRCRAEEADAQARLSG